MNTIHELVRIALTLAVGAGIAVLVVLWVSHDDGAPLRATVEVSRER